jgi:hypothetical protein
MREPPFKRDNTLTKAAASLCEALASTPEELWPEDVLRLRKTSTIRLLDSADLLLQSGHSIPQIDARSVEEEYADQEEAAYLLSKMRPREAELVRRVVMEGETLLTAAEDFGISPERTRQVILDGLRRAREKARVQAYAR